MRSRSHDDTHDAATSSGQRDLMTHAFQLVGAARDVLIEATEQHLIVKISIDPSSDAKESDNPTICAIES